jgi:hypothetical protein
MNNYSQLTVINPSGLSGNMSILPRINLWYRGIRMNILAILEKLGDALEGSASELIKLK